MIGDNICSIFGIRSMPLKINGFGIGIGQR